MARYIDVEKINLPEGFFNKVDNVPKFYEWVETIPTADAVEVVRCKDCVLRWSACPMVVRSMDENGGLRVSFFTEDDDYCSRGKK